ncbi:Dyp-type peroxidase [Streptomyces bambusae]|uniref:Dyp-type peroxidase n=1 Tax=Streptomyces bambusae TaxID=1550616 RepID=UPI001D0007E1|nr:Dyp-type peroxidase [Streptomyces bambusae]MCB5169532.1 Dyp-type peroxidase [Streptomyces bambusae]
MSGPSRRTVLATAAAAAGLAGAATACGRETDGADAAGPAGGTGHGASAAGPSAAGPSAARAATPAVAVARQRGVSDPQPPHVLLLAYDLSPGPSGSAARQALDGVLARWRARAEGGGLTTTVTVGFGPRLPARLGTAGPGPLREPPAFPGDRLRPEAGGGDLLLQICGPTAAACAGAGAALDRTAGPAVRLRWRQPGFLPPGPRDETPRNLLGFKDGTANPDRAGTERWVWIGSGPHAGGTYLVFRRIRLRTAAFTGLPAIRQERIIGRRRADGTPLHGGTEHTDVDLFAKTPEGRYVLPADAHARLAHSRYDGGARMLRRGYSYDDGAADRGLLFLAFMNDPALFTRVQQRLAAADALNAFAEHVASGVYLVPPATAAGRVPF